MSLKGNLESFMLSSILELLHNEKKTGSLSLKNGVNEAQIIIETGNIVYAMSPSKAARLGSLMINMGLINSEQLDACLDEGKQKKQALGKILVEKGIITMDQLKRIIQIQVEEIIYGLFLWDTGEFVYNEIKLDLSSMAVTYLDLTTIVLESARRHDEMSVLKKYITDSRVVFKTTDKIKNNEAQVGVNELAMLGLIDGFRTVDDLIDDSYFGRFYSYKILYSLLSSGLIEKQEESPLQKTDYFSVLQVYINFLKIIWRNLEPEIGKEAFVLFNNCRPVTLPGQFDILKDFTPEITFTYFISRLEEKLKPFRDLRYESLSLIDSFNRFVVNILNRIPKILSFMPSQKMLEEIEQVLPNLAKFQEDLNIKSDIIADFRTIMDRVLKQMVEKERRNLNEVKKMKNKTLSVLIILFVLLVSQMIASPGDQTQTADLVLINGKIVTMDESKPTAEALAVSKGIIIAVGAAKEITPFISKTTRVIDLNGKLAIPGFIESHGHFSMLGKTKMELDLTTIRNWDEAVELVAAAVKKAKPGEWILGRGWHQEKWDRLPTPNLKGLPLHDSMSKISPGNPVLLDHASGHSTFANSKAMELAGITGKTQNPDGGEIQKDNDGNPTGIFVDTAEDLVYSALEKHLSLRTPEQVEAFNTKKMELADCACLENGVTSFGDAGASFETVDLYKKLLEQGKLGVRLNVMLNETNEALLRRISEYKISDMYEHHLRVMSIKRLIDGALGSHSAWLLKPYDSLPTSVGLNTDSIDSMKETARIAIENGFQLCTHAIGDRANRETLNVYEDAFKQNPGKKDLRWRVEHAQHIDPADIPRFGKLGVIAAMQGIHCTSDGPWVIKRLGEERSGQGAYVWRKLMNTGAIISNGTDVPVEDVNPIACFYATVTRKMKDGKVFFGDQRMTREEALRSYTLNGAYASFEAKIKGSLSVGKLADITVLSKDIMIVPEDEILSAHAVYTIIGGKILYQR